MQSFSDLNDPRYKLSNNSLSLIFINMTYCVFNNNTELFCVGFVFVIKTIKATKCYAECLHMFGSTWTCEYCASSDIVFEISRLHIMNDNMCIYVFLANWSRWFWDKYEEVLVHIVHNSKCLTYLCCVEI